MSTKTITEISGDDEMDFGEIALTLRRQVRRIVVVTVFVTVLAVAYVLLSRPQFAIGGSIYLGDARPSAPVGQQVSGLNFLSDFQAVSDINTQVELIKSKGLVEQAILESGLNAPVRAADAPVLQFWKWLLFYGQTVSAFAPQPGDLLAKDAVIADAGSAAQKFIVVMGDHGAYTIARKTSWSGTSAAILAGSLGQPAAGGGLSLLLSPAVAGVVPPAGSIFILKITSAEAVASQLEETGRFTALAGGAVNNPTKIANLQLLAANPYTGTRFVNQLMSDFAAGQLSWNNQAASATQIFIANQLAGLKSSLADADKKLASYQAQTGILDVPENAKALIGQLSNYETERAALQLQQETLQQLNAGLAHPDGPLNPYLLSQTGDSVLGQLATDLAAEETRLEALQSQFTGSAPDVQVEQASVDRIEQSIRSVVGNELASANAGLARLDAQIAQFNGQLRAMPAESLQVVALTRASEVYGQTYVLLMQKEEEAEVSKAAAIGDTRIITPAEIPLRAASPKAVLTILAGIVLGLFAGAGLVLGQRSLSTRFQSEEDVRRLITLPVYGVIPLRPQTETSEMMPMPHPQSAFAEPLRMLRGNIIRSAAPQASRVLLLTSSGTDDGKTTIAVNLAKILADGGKRVVLVDGDLHRGRLHEVLRTAPYTGGLAEWLVTMTPPAMMPVPGQRFVMLTTGVLPPNPSELIHEPYLANIIAKLRADFDYVVIDSPPLPATADGMVLGELADLILSVVMVGHTSRQAFTVHNEMLARLGRRHGIIINGAVGVDYGYGYGMAQENGPAAKLRRLLEWV